MKIKFKLFFCNILLLLNFSFNSIGQTKPDTVHINKYFDSCEYYLYKNIDSTFYFAKKILSDTNISNFEKGNAKSNYFIAEYYEFTGNFFEADSFYTNSLNIYISLDYQKDIMYIQNRLSWLNILKSEYAEAIILAEKVLENPNIDEKTMLVSYNNIGSAYFYIGNYSQAISYFLKALVIHEKNNNLTGTIFTNNNIAAIYSMQEKYSEALKLYRKNLEIFENEIYENDKAITYNNIGTVYLELGKNDSAIYYFNLAYDLNIKSKNKSELARVTTNIGQHFFNIGNYELANSYLIQAINYYTQLENKTGLAICYYHKAQLNKKLKKFSDAIKNCQKAIDYADTSNSNSEKLKSILLLSELFSLNSNFAEAYKNLLIYTKLKDSIIEIDNKNFIENTNLIYESAKNQQIIEILETKQKINNIEIERKKLIIKLLLIFAITIFILVIILLRLYSKLKQSYKILVKNNLNNLEIDNQTKKIDELSDKELHIFEQFENLLIVEKIFINENISLDDLAKRLNTNRSLLSKIINQKYQNNFNNIINECRIKEVCRLLNQHKYEDYTLEGLAQNVGFNSRSTFNSAFKKFVGVTPSFYIKSIQNN